MSEDAAGLDGHSVTEENPAGNLLGKRARRRAQQIRVQKENTQLFQGFPSLASLKPSLLFLSFPAFIAFLLVIPGGGWSPLILYPIAIGIGLYVAASAYRTMELIAVCIVFYLPFAHQYAINIAPGLNGTNALILLGLFGTVVRVYSKRDGWAKFIPGTWLVVGFGMYSALSGFTILREPGGWEFLIYGELVNYKGWLDQFLIYFILLNAIRDRDMAKRMILYMAISSMVVVVATIPEMIDKMGLSSIEKSRLGGPFSQANNFGGFIAYTILPLMAIFMVYLGNIRAWLLTPYFLLAAKILITTFSRAAYLGIAMGGLMAAWFRGKRFMILWSVIGLSGLALFPQLLPDSILARLGQTTQTTEKTTIQDLELNQGNLDASSAYRLVMWKAAGRMILDNPILGKGYKGYQKTKSEYTDVDLPWLSDPHNMYLFVGSQMGLPALTLFLLILFKAFSMGWRLSKDRQDQFVRAIGIGGASAVVAYSIIGFFGSRMVTLDFTVHFWMLFVVLQVLSADQKLLGAHGRAARRQQKRGARPDTSEPGTALEVVDDDAAARPLSRRKQRSKRQAAAPDTAGRRTRKRTNAFSELKKRENGEQDPD